MLRLTQRLLRLLRQALSKSSDSSGPKTGVDFGRLNCRLRLYRKPFDKRYEAIQERLAGHGAAFQSELSEINQQSLISYFHRYEKNVQKDRDEEKKQKERAKGKADKNKVKNEHRRMRKEAKMKVNQAAKLSECSPPKPLKAFVY